METKISKVKEKRSENYFQELQNQTLSVLGAFIFELDIKGNIKSLSHTFQKYLPKATIEHRILNFPFINFVDEEDRPRMQNFFSNNTAILPEDKKIDKKMRIHLTLAKKEFWINGSFSPIIQNGTLLGFRGIFQDITEAITREKLIEFMAFHDDLTGLPNRIEIERNLGKKIEAARRNGKFCALGFLGLDNFKEINNGLGYKTGDRIIFSTAIKLSKKLPENIFFGRWSGDIFAFILSDIKSEKEIRRFGEDLIKKGNTPVKFKDSLYYVPYSIGFSLFPRDANSIEMLFTNAEITLNWVKKQGRNNFLLFSDLPNKNNSENPLALRNKLNDAVKNNKIQIFFQPKINSKTGLVCGMEALSRWYDDELGWVNPEVFIALAESVGLISQIGEQIIEKSIKLYSSMHNQDIKLAINISLSQLYQLNFIEKIVQEVEKNKISPRNIILEITESIAMLEAKQAIDKIKALKQRGFEIAIDDFGKGYSSLSRLNQMPLDELKIDLSFIKKIHTPKGLRILKAIKQIAQATGLRTVAEGVEDKESVKILKDIGIDMFQGYYFSRPLPFNEFKTFLENNSLESP